MGGATDITEADTQDDDVDEPIFPDDGEDGPDTPPPPPPDIGPPPIDIVEEPDEACEQAFLHGSRMLEDARCTMSATTCVDEVEEYRANACGCACMPCTPRPNRVQVARTFDECANIDFDCSEGFDVFGAFGSPCGCGCEITNCIPERFRGTSGMAEPFALGASCEFLIACSTQPIDAGLGPAFLAHYPDARCIDGGTFGCPTGTASHCEAFIRIVDESDALAACAISLEETVERIICGGDL